MTKKIAIERVITGVPQDQSVGQDLEDMMRMMTMKMLWKQMVSIIGGGIGLIPPLPKLMMKEKVMKRTGIMSALNQGITLAIHRKRRHSSKKRSDEENESDRDGRDHRHSRKKHRSQHSSGHGRDNHRHRSRHSSGDKKSGHHLKHDSSSDDAQNHTSLDKSGKEMYDERDELEEGEISSKVSEGSRGIASGHVSRETSVDALISHERANSQPPEITSEVPDDLRAKIRAMLIATRL